jgi:hypothetical protein
MESIAPVASLVPDSPRAGVHGLRSYSFMKRGQASNETSSVIAVTSLPLIAPCERRTLRNDAGRPGAA